jgi:hypothetical protein
LVQQYHEDQSYARNTGKVDTVVDQGAQWVMILSPCIIFKDEHEAEKWAWLFEPMGYHMCCANGFYNAWIYDSRLKE